MPFLGFGASAFGVTPFGFGAVPTISASVPKIFIKSDGSQGNAPNIDPTTHDYVLDPTTGIRQGADSTPIMVQLALLTVKGSSAVPDLGMDLPGGVFTPDTAKRVDKAARSALADLVKRKLISIQRVTFTRLNQGAASIGVSWIDLATGEAVFNAITL